MKIVCDSCSTKYSIADEKVRGKVFKIKCKKCGHIIVVKGSEQAAASPEGAPPAGFDQKETRVFDYSGMDPAAPPGADAGPGAEAVWHLVVDGEQVGPLTAGEVQARYARQEIDDETYGWREGFADWLRLGSIDELRAVLKGEATVATSAPAPEPGLFASTTPGTQPDPADLFATAGASPSGGGDAGGAGDLFAGRPAQANSEFPMAAAGGNGGGGYAAPAASQTPDLFASGVGAAAGYGGGGYGGGEDATGQEVKLTAQRNENSVLFSLSNLAALATSEASAPKGSSGGGGGGGPVPGAGLASSTTEGSGLIDIRAMAALTLGTRKDEPRGPKSTGSIDDLPVFSPSAFSAPAAGVLLPTAQPASNNKMLYALVGVVGLLALVAIVLVVVVVKGGNNSRSGGGGDQVTTTAGDKTPPGTTGQAGINPGTGGDSGNGSSGGNSGGNPGGGDTGSAVTPPAGGNSNPAGTTRDPEKGSTTKTPERGSTTKTPERGSTTKTPEKGSTTTKQPDPPVKTPTQGNGGKCDEVTCLVDPTAACCKGRGGSSSGGGGGGGGGGSSSNSNLPAKLERGDIQAGVGGVKGRVMACNDQYGVAGTVNVKFAISGDGSVTSATVSGQFAGTPTGSCVERAIRAARFKKWAGPSMSVTYPFAFK